MTPLQTSLARLSLSTFLRAPLPQPPPFPATPFHTISREMPSMPPRTAVFLFHPSHKTTRSSPPLPTCSRALPQHTTTRKRPQPQNRHAPPTRQSTISFFSTTSARAAREQNYYEILDLPITATAGEIKKYHLPAPTNPQSKCHQARLFN